MCSPAILIIYFLYMLYFDRMHEEHFGSIKQQAWSFLHFPLHVALVLLLQGVSLLIIWRQAVVLFDSLFNSWEPALRWLIEDGDDLGTDTPFGVAMSSVGGNYTAGTAFADYFNQTCYTHVYNYIPKGVDASKEIKAVAQAWKDIQQGLDAFEADRTNNTAYSQLFAGVNTMASATYKTLFDTLSVTVAEKKGGKSGGEEILNLEQTNLQYYQVFDLIVSYTFIAVGTLDYNLSFSTNKV
jgi:hypothetical protein